MIVTALRDLAAEERHRTAVTEQRLAEERAWNEEERQRDAELRALIAQLVARNGSRTNVDEFGVREGLRTETITPTAAARGLGVGGSGEDDALLALLLASSRL
jgi:transposase